MTKPIFRQRTVNEWMMLADRLRGHAETFRQAGDIEKAEEFAEAARGAEDIARRRLGCKTQDENPGSLQKLEQSSISPLRPE